MLLIADEMPEWNCFGPQDSKGAAVTLHLFVEDADATMKRAEVAGATVTMPIEDTFWGDRYGHIIDPFGHTWAIATRIKDLTEEEIIEGAKKAFQTRVV